MERKELKERGGNLLNLTYLCSNFFRRATALVDLAVDLRYHSQAVSSSRRGWRCLQCHAQTLLTDLVSVKYIKYKKKIKNDND